MKFATILFTIATAAALKHSGHVTEAADVSPAVEGDARLALLSGPVEFQTVIAKSGRKHKKQLAEQLKLSQKYTVMMDSRKSHLRH